MMLACTKPLLKPSLAVARHFVVACASNQDRLYPLYCKAYRESRSTSTKSLKDITPPYLLNQLKYNSDSYLQRDFHDDDDYERYSQMIPRNITQNAASMASSQDDIAYDEDYDQFYSHMTPSSIENQDHEELESLEMVQHEDVGPSEQRHAGNDSILYEASTQEPLSYAEQVEEEEFVELEEDWEIMHQNLNCRVSSGTFEVCDNVDDVIQ